MSATLLGLIGVPRGLTHELLVGAVFYRLLFSGQPLDDGLGSRVVDAVLRAFAAR